MTNQKYYCDNEITDEKVWRDEDRRYPLHIDTEEPSLFIQALWIIGIASTAICVVLIAFGLVDL
jgi:hypothetical protein